MDSDQIVEDNCRRRIMGSEMVLVEDFSFVVGLIFFKEMGNSLFRTY